LRALLFGLLGIVIASAIGFFAFLLTLPRPNGHSPRAEAVVVYTGVGGQRIAAGMKLLEEGAGERLLISGVHPETTRSSIAALWPGEPAQFECCVDLGIEAKTTIGNAREVGDWAARHGYKRLILVTSDYHMPRALVETRDYMNSAAIVPYAVRSGFLSERGAPVGLAGWRNLVVEYLKYLAASARTLVS
jgi:uncharacterized SAM-binding protein YcdF (DUF218 family)